MEFVDNIVAIEKSLYSSEKLGEEVLQNKQQLTEYDKKRQANRESLRELKKLQPKVEEVNTKQEKVWLCTGSTFIKLPLTKAVTTIQKDQEEIETTISKIQEELKSQVYELEKIESECKGLKEWRAKSFQELKPLSKGESFNSIKK